MDHDEVFAQLLLQMLWRWKLANHLCAIAGTAGSAAMDRDPPRKPAALPTRADEIPVLHEALLDAQRGLRDGEAKALVRELRAKPSPTREVRNQRIAAQTQQKRNSVASVRSSMKMHRQRLVFITVQDFEDAVLVRQTQESLLRHAFIILPDTHWTAVHPIRIPGLPEESAVRLDDCVIEQLQAKEINGTLFWLGSKEGKGQSFEELSAWIRAKADPATGNRYHALQMNTTWWRRRFPMPSVPPKFTRSGEKIARSLQSTSTEPHCLLEMLHQSNPGVFKFMTSLPRNPV
mmetsp:Transcript_11504/g.22622  ORF Transcript_11504/g.22622 Transcript_11504/m.22622 type:complete len:290 (+) Transcript_11504:2691-3560(+)